MRSFEEYYINIAKHSEALPISGMVCGEEKCIELFCRDYKCGLIAVIEKGKIWVSFVFGKLKELVETLVILTGIRNVIFCTIINPALVEKLRNVKKIFKLYTPRGETVCVEVEWEVNF